MVTKTRNSAGRGGTGQGLTEERILEAALKIIDNNGLAKFSVRDVARALGVYPTALYWYVKNRDEILARVISYATRDIASPDVDQDWRDWLRAFLGSYRKSVQQHPNIAPLIGAQLIANGGIRADMIDRILTVLTKAGFADELLIDAYNVVISAQVGFVTQELAQLPADDLEAWAEAHRKRISTIDVMAYPTLARHLPAMANRAFILRWSNGSTVPLDSSFDLFVDVVILGLEQKLSMSKAKTKA